MKVYLAGKITGDPNYREKFAAAAKKLEERAGVTVISPAVTPEGLKKADYMRIALPCWRAPTRRRSCRIGRTAPAHSLKSTGASTSERRWCF